MSLVVDASVWVAAADASDAHSVPSRAFLGAVTARQLAVVIPSIARLEVACALARRSHDAQRAQALAEALAHAPMVTERPLDRALLTRAIREGTLAWLRGTDALYAALASQTGGELVSWDRELIQLAGARSPTDWLADHP